MPWSRLRVLLSAIPALQAEDDLRALTIAGVGANPGEKGQTFRDVSNSLQRAAGGTGRQNSGQRDTVIAGVTPGVTALDDADGLLAELRAKRAAWQAEHERRQAGKPRA